MKVSLPAMRVRAPFFAPDEPPAGGAPEGAPAAPAAPAPAPTEGTPAGGAPAPESSPPEGGSTRDSYTRAEFEKVQNEAKNLREKYAPYRDTFDEYPDEDREAWIWLAKEYRTNPKGAIEAMERLVTASKEEQQAAAAEGAKPLTRAELEAALAERDSQTAAEREAADHKRIVDDINHEAEGLGYKQGTIDLSDLFFIAQHETNGDLKAAHEKVSARKQAIIDEYLEAKREEAQGGRRVVRPGSTPGGAPDAGPKTFEDAKASLIERMKNAG